MSVEIRGLRFSYGDTEVLKGVDADMPAGVTALLGPNGAGKSTLVKCLAGVHVPSEGFALFNGAPLLRPGRDPGVRVAYLPQDQPTVVNTTVLEFMLLGRVGTLGITVKDADIDACYGALEMLRVEGLADRRVDELSGGQYQMVMIAQCLSAEPELLILDEPMNNLDLRRELDMFDTMCRITAERGLTTLMVLHDVNFACRYADRVYVLRDGSVYDAGTPEEVVTERMLLEVYGVEAEVGTDREGRPKVDPIRAVR